MKMKVSKLDRIAVEATSMLVTDVGDKMCLRQFLDVGDDFRRFCHHHPLSFNICVGHQKLNDVTNIEILALKSNNCHQHPIVTNIYVAAVGYVLLNSQKQNFR